MRWVVGHHSLVSLNSSVVIVIMHPSVDNPRIQALARALKGPLPGERAQRMMWPEELSSSRFLPPPPDARLAAVLVLLYECDGRVCFPLQVRRRVEGDPHGGEISLPGGHREGEETVEATALREAREELGISPERVHLLGRLSRIWISVSHAKVRPVVAWAEEPPRYRLDPREVDRVIVCSLEELEDPSRRIRFPREWNGTVHHIPAWRLQDGLLWGATAMILSELLTLLHEAEEHPPSPGRGN